MIKKAKRGCSLFLAAVLLTGALAGCGNKAQQREDASPNGIAEGTEQTAEESDAVREEAETEAQAEAAKESGITVTDQAGREVWLAAPAENIVSSYYISTALLIALGCEDKLTGIEMKAEQRQLYQLAAPQLLTLPAVGSGKGVNIEETAALSPDVVILPLRLSEQTEALEALHIPVVVVNPETQEDFEACVALLAEITGTKERGDKLLSYYKEKREMAEEMTRNLERPAVYFSSASSYLSTCTSKMYQSDLIRIAGGRNVSEELTENYFTEISPEQLLLWNPDYMFAVSYAKYALTDIADDEALSEVSAVRNGRISTFPSLIEPWDYPTPSSVLGILWLTNRLHPEVYSEEQYRQDAEEFYADYFDIEVTAEQLGIE